MPNFKNRSIFGVHNHPFSLDSANTVEYFLKTAAKDFNRKAIAITDHGTIGSIIECCEVAKKIKKDENIDLKVVPGVELYLLPEEGDDSGYPYYHLTIHFKDFDAYLHNSKLSKSAFDRAIYKGGELKPLTTWEELESMSGKVTILSGCMLSPVNRPVLKGRKDLGEKYFKRLMNIAGPGKFFAEIFPYEVSKNWNGKTKTFEPIINECVPDGRLQVECNKWIMHLCSKYNIPMVISEDAHFAKPEEKPVQDIRLAGNGGGWKMSDANCLHSTEWLYKEFQRLHPDYINEKTFNELIDNGEKCLENFKGFEPSFKHALPKIEINGQVVEMTDDEMVQHVVAKVIKKGLIDLSNPVYRDRLKREIDQLAYNGQVNIIPYFLVLEEIIEWCKENEVLVGPGRGSSAGCLLNYALGITYVDPIKEDLSFERFFDVSRVKEGLADIDTDFSDRSKVVDFIKSRWGDKVAYLGTGVTFKTKSALLDIDRLLHGSVRQETLDVCKAVPASPQGVSEDDFLRGYVDADGHHVPGELEKNQKLMAYLRTNVECTKILFKMIGLVRQMSTHAAGIIIADRPVHEFIPVTKINDEFTTQLLPKWVERCGGIKYDILGLNTLEDIRNCLKYIKERHGIDIDPWNIKDTPKMWEEALHDTDTIFQLHTDTVRPGFLSMRPKSVQEAAILTSVYRPGAMDAPSEDDPHMTMEKVFIARWNGSMSVRAVHPDLNEILGPTKQTIVFQEQIMSIVHNLGGLSMVETQKLRKAISKKASDDLIVLLNKVRDHLVSVRGWSIDQAETICNQMKASGKYSFNKSHAVAYSYIARTCIYLKWKYPLEWWAAILSNKDRDKSALKKYWIKNNDLILKPDINKSTNRFEIVKVDNKEMVLPPMSSIERIGAAVLTELIAKRPYASFEDFLSKIDKRIINKRIVFQLIFSGCIDYMFDEGTNEYEKIETYLKAKAKIEKSKKIEQVPEEYRNMTSLKKELLKKSVYKVYTSDLLKAAIPQLTFHNLIKYSGPGNSVISLDFDKYKNVPLVDSTEMEHIMEGDQYGDVTFGVIAYIDKPKEKKYSGNTKSMLNVLLEIDDTIIDAVKWPDYKKDVHGVDIKKIEKSISLVILNKREGSSSISIRKIIPIEKI